MKVQVATCSANSLLTDQVIPVSSDKFIIGKLTIPEYQRPYCWQEEQLKKILSDIKEHKRNHPALPYYLGSLIFHQQGEALNIIDGQQRITTLGLLASLLDSKLQLPLEYDHPISQLQIQQNIAWLRANHEKWQSLIDLNLLEFTLVVTRSEDDAYRFFETQNTGGVRLGGPDIIKAHHLRAVEKVHQGNFAKQWESLGKLDNVIKALLKGRYWQGVNPRLLPSHLNKTQVKESIVVELGEKTGKGGDIAYGRLQRHIGLAGEASHQLSQQGYDVRQPLNAGVNSIRYLSYFQGLYQKYWKAPNLPHLQGYQDFIEWLEGIEGCGFLEDLYVACLLLYISQFGEKQLEVAAKKLFRVVYSRRVSNQKAVRENSIPAFVKETPVLDWIALSYTPEQCFNFLDSFKLVVDSNNLDKNTVKRRYISAVNAYFSLGLTTEQYAQGFASALTHEIIGDEL